MKKLYLLLAVLFVFVNCFAQPVKKDYAKEVAENFMQNILPAKQHEIKVSSSFTEKYNSEETFHVFNFKEGGFAIIAADERINPLLAYSENSYFPEDYQSMSNLRIWLESVNKEILRIKEKDLPALKEEWAALETKSFSAPKAEVDPLITTTWGQGSGYNNYAPENVPVGCVATAMAQIMNYHEYPAKGVSWHQYNHPEYGIQKAYFDTVTYDYSSMPDDQGNDEVSELMYHCAVSVDMNFADEGSGASDRDIPIALANYFKYNQSMDFVSKSEYSDQEWMDLLKAELDNARPILYSGTNDNSGHEFICDGYNSSDMFHFNWGWNGSSDGYYEIGSLNPGSTTYNQNNAAVIGIEPAGGKSDFYFVPQYTDFPEKSTYPGYIDGVSDKVAWATGRDGSGDGADFTVFTRTTDGGGTWNGAEITCDATAFSMISGLNKDTAFIAAYGSGSSNQILKTTDGGENWDEVLAGAGSSSFFNVVHFFDDNNGFVQGDPESDEFELYITSDCGENWTRVDGANIPDPNSGSEYGIVGHYTAVEDTIWFTTNEGRIYKSEDKGATWEVYDIYTGSNGTYIDVAFDDGGQNGLAHVQLTDGGSVVGNELYQTTDGGETWTENTSYTGYFYYSGISSIPGEPNTFVSVGADYETPRMGVSYTTDGGKTWKDYAAYYQNKQFISVDFVSSSRGYAGAFQGDFNSGMFVFGQPYAQLKANFSCEDDEGVDTTFCVNTPITFSNQSNGYIESYTWNFGNGANPAIAAGMGPHNVTYETGGEKNVKLTVEDSIQEKSFSDVIMIDSIVPGEIDTVQGPREIDLTDESSVDEIYSATSFDNVKYQWTVPNSSYWQGESDSSSIEVTFSGGTLSGMFYVTAYNGCGISNTYAFEVETTKETETAIFDRNEDELKLYPIPAFNVLYIENAQNTTIYIYDVMGSLVKSMDVNKTVKELNVQEYKEGMYILKVEQEGKIMSKPFMISR